MAKKTAEQDAPKTAEHKQADTKPDAPEQVEGVRFFSDFARYNFGGVVQFEGGRATVTDPAVVDRMKAHAAFGRDYHLVPA